MLFPCFSITLFYTLTFVSKNKLSVNCFRKIIIASLLRRTAIDALVLDRLAGMNACRFFKFTSRQQRPKTFACLNTVVKEKTTKAAKWGGNSLSNFFASSYDNQRSRPSPS